MRTILAIFLFLAAGTMAEAQSWLGHVGRTAVRRAKDRAIERTEEKIYQSVEKSVDKAVDKAWEETEEAITETAEEAALERAGKQKEAEARKQQVLKQFAGRPASGKDPFYMSKEGMVITTAAKDAKGKVTSYTKTSIVSIDYRDSRNLSVEAASEVYSDKMELMMSSPMNSKVIVEDGVVTFDPESMAGQLTAGMEISGDFFFVPDNIEVGDILMDYRVEIAIGPMKTVAENTDVHVSGRETLKISGHEIDCYIIESKVFVKALGIKSETVQKTWYGRAVGQVKTETYASNGKLQTVNEIVEIEGL